MKTFRSLLCVAGSVLLSVLSAKATPYASGVTNISGTIQFILNEIPDSAWVVFNNGTTNVLSPVVGTNTFPLGTNTSYAIYCVKSGNGTATQISSDTGTYNTWAAPVAWESTSTQPTDIYLGAFTLTTPPMAPKAEGYSPSTPTSPASWGELPVCWAAPLQIRHPPAVPTD